jgi:hypothetical protein
MNERSQKDDAERENLDRLTGIPHWLHIELQRNVFRLSSRGVTLRGPPSEAMDALPLAVIHLTAH